MNVPRVTLFGLLLSLCIAGVGRQPAPAVGLPAVAPGPAVFISSPRQSIPAPVHDEATCAFCQAAAFAPQAAAGPGTLVLVAGDEQRIQLSHDTHLLTSGSARPPRSRAPPAIRSV